MRKGILKFGAKTGLVGLEAVAVAVGVVLLVAGAMVWRIASGPFDVGFARNYITEALHDPATGTDVGMDDVSLSWPVFKGPLELNLKNVTLRRDGRQIVSVQDVALGLSMTHLLLGRVEPIAIMLQKPVLGMIRTADNNFQISLHQPQQPTAAAGPEANPLMDVIDALMAPKSKDRHSPLAGLKTVKIADATLVLEDHYANLTWYLQHMNFEFGRDKKGLAVSAGLALPGGGPNPATMHLDAVYGRDQGDIRFNLHLDRVDLASGAGKLKQLDFLFGQTLVMTGDLSGRLDKAMTLQTLALSLSSPSGAIAVPGQYDEPLPYQNLQLLADYDGTAKKAAVRQFQLTVRGVTLKGAADMALADGGAKATVRLNIPQIAQAQIAPLWPDSLREDGARKWLVEKIDGGTARNVNVQFGIAAARKTPPSAPDANAEPAPPQWAVAVQDIEGAFDASGMTIDYRHPLIPAKGVNGHGVFKGGDLDIDIAQGSIGDMNVAGSHVKLVDIIHAHLGKALIDIKASGPIKTLFRYIQDEPINVTAQQLGFKTDQAKGETKLAVQVAFPTVKDLKADEVKVKVDGTLTDILLPAIVENMDLTGGPFHLEVADAAASLSGNGKLDGHDIKASLQQYLHAEGHPFSAQIKASLLADDDLRKKFGADLADWIGGAVPVDIVYTVQADHHATVDIKADMTPGTVTVIPFGYAKQPGTAGELSCTAALFAGHVQKIESLHIKTPELLIDNGTLFFGPRDGRNGLTGGAMPVAKLGDTNVALNFQMGDNRLVKLDGKGAFFDASYFLANRQKASPDAPPLIATITVDKMRTGPNRMLQNVSLLFDRAAGGGYNRIHLAANAGKGSVSLKLDPDDTGRMALRLEADDAGEVLRAFNIYQNAEGGKLLIQGRSPDASRKNVIEGHAQLSDFKVVKAPVLARLLNAVNLIGIPELLASDGISFTRLESDFEWNIRPEGDRYIIKDGRTSGASIGLTFDGSVDKSTSQTKIRGTIVPVSGINGLVGHIPVLGTLLTGGGALFAFTYEISGPSDNPSVSVNPLSALAPGILREIFFKTK